MTSSHSPDFAGSLVNMNVAPSNITVKIARIANSNMDPEEITSKIPPIHTIAMKIGNTYLTTTSHHLPNLIDLLFALSLGIMFYALNIQANIIHSNITPIKIAI